MWSIILWEFFLLSLALIREFPLDRRPQAQTRSRLEIGIIYHSHRIRTRPPVRLGTVQAGFGVTRAGVYQGSLLISTPVRAQRPGSQAGLRRLIINPGRVSAGGHAKGRPAQVAFSLTAGGCCPLRVMACAAGCSSVRVVTRTADVKLSKYKAFRLPFIVISRIGLVCRALGTFVTYGSHFSECNPKLLQTYYQLRYIIFHLGPICALQQITRIPSQNKVIE